MFFVYKKNMIITNCLAFYDSVLISEEYSVFIKDKEYMEQFLGGIALLCIGIMLTFTGYQLFRVLIPIWGFIAGFSWIVDAFALGNGTGFLASVFGIIIALVTGLIFAGFAYFFYEFAVGLLAASVGYWLIAGILTWMGLPFGFFGVVTALIAGLALAFVTIYYKAPKALLVLLTAIGGGAVIITGLMLMFGLVPSVILGYGMMGYIIKQSIFWTLSWVGLIAIGIVSQLQLSQMMSNNKYMYPTYSQSPFIGTKGGSATKEDENDEKDPKAN